ncbi:MAG: hypothetical protein ACOC8X_13565 [Chloroflexota bacterium]
MVTEDLWDIPTGSVRVYESEEEARERFGTAWGAATTRLLPEHLEALQEGKCLAFWDGEYVNFLLKGDPHEYVANRDAQRVKAVYLDGEDVTAQTIACNTAEGWVDFLPKDENGDFIPDGLDVKVERRRGSVQVVLEGEV